MNTRYKKIFFSVLFSILIVACFLIVNVLYNLQINRTPIITSYSYNTIGNCRIIHLSDLHNYEYGIDNSMLINLVLQQNPDIIVMTGDMINKDDPDTTIISNLVSELSSQVSVFYSYGNHEKDWDETWGKHKNTSIREIIVSHGGVVLNNDYLDLDINSIPIRIGGYMGYYRNTIMLNADQKTKAEHEAFFCDFENTDRFKILLNHIPTQWLDWDHINQHASSEELQFYEGTEGVDLTGYDVDLVFSGHYHGGQWICPIIGPVYDPYNKFHAKYSKGLFSGNQATCILTSGLGNECRFIPRINNPPEIVITDLY